MSEIILFFTSRWVIMFLFIGVIIVGAVIAGNERRKGSSQEKGEQEEELEQTIAACSNINQAPWHAVPEEAGRKKGKLESFYTGKMSRWGNMKTIIAREQQMTFERAKDLQQRNRRDKEEKCSADGDAQDSAAQKNNF